MRQWRRLPESMSALTIVTAPGSALLASVRDLLATSDEALLCVAFAQPRGVHLVAEELRAIAKRGRARVVVTTTLGMSAPSALAALDDTGAAVRVLNPGGSTYHPKVFLGRRGERLRAIVGSANLTSGLIANVEVATTLDGAANDNALVDLWSWGERIWSDPRTARWLRPEDISPEESIEPELLARLVALQRATPTVYTLGHAPRPNFMRDVAASGLWVETARSAERATRLESAGVELVPPRMLNLAWDALRARGTLSNQELLGELRIHRSSFVCAVLAKLPEVEVVPGKKIVLRWRG